MRPERCRILIVDDNVQLAENLREVLESAVHLGAEVETAANGAAALTWVKRHRYEVAVVDVKLPDQSGVELIAPLLEANPHGQIILVTGNATVETAIAALRAGAAGFVLKSFRPEELIVTVEKALAKIALEKRLAEAEALNAMAPLALGLAHEIRNPLNAAVLELHLLSREIERLDATERRDPMAKRVRVVETEIKRLERLLTEFLELARPRGPQREPLDVSRVVAEVLELEAEAFGQRRVSVLSELEPCAQVLGDVEKLKQVVLNLVVNALDVMPDGGTLHVTVQRDSEHIVLAVSDSGPGISPEIAGEVFDPFFTTKPAGTGLGLAIVRKIVEQHAGDIRIGPNPNEAPGARVEVRIPVVDSPRPR